MTVPGKLQQFLKMEGFLTTSHHRHERIPLPRPSSPDSDVELQLQEGREGEGGHWGEIEKSRLFIRNTTYIIRLSNVTYREGGHWGEIVMDNPLERIVFVHLKHHIHISL